MNFFKDVCSDHCMQVCFHIFEHKIDISVIFGLQHIQESEHNNKKWLLNSLEQGFYWAFKRRNTRGQLKGRGCFSYSLDDIFMVVEFLEEHNFPKCSLQ